MAARRLSGFGTRALDALTLALSDESPEVRGQAATSLGVIGSEASVPHLVRLLVSDSYPFVRRTAAEALGRVGGEEAREALEQALQDPEPVVWRTAERALEALEGSEPDR